MWSFIYPDRTFILPGRRFLRFVACQCVKDCVAERSELSMASVCGVPQFTVPPSQQTKPLFAGKTPQVLSNASYIIIH